MICRLFNNIIYTFCFVLSIIVVVVVVLVVELRCQT